MATEHMFQASTAKSYWYCSSDCRMLRIGSRDLQWIYCVVAGLLGLGSFSRRWHGP